MNKLLTILLFLTCKICIGQNLVPNPSFEVYDTCPDNLFQVDRATGWFGANGTADYFNSCFVYPGSGWNVGVPANWMGYQQAYEGNGYIGMATYIKYDSSVIAIREAIGVQLPTPLVAGTKYYASFYSSLANNTFANNGCGSNKLGLMFSNSQYLTSFSGNVTPFNNQSKFFTDSIIIDSTNWVKISGSFISDSNYAYMYVGNFFTDSSVSSIPFSIFNGWSYYYVDNICLSTDSLTCNATVGIKEPKQNTEVSLFPNPFSNQLTLTLTNNEPTTIILYDFLSRQIFEKTFANSTTINTQQFEDGIYFYQLRNSKRIIANGKVVKN